MLSKEQFIASFEHEVRVCKHLFMKLPEGSYDYRPSPEQRSATELLRYLAACSIGITQCYLEGGWDAWKRQAEKVADMAPEDFPAAMDHQAAEMRALLDGISEETLNTQEVTLPWGVKMMLGAAIVEGALKWIVAYRMQLFLYAKAAGAHEIGTSDCWAGVERQPKPAPEVVEEAAG